LSARCYVITLAVLLLAACNSYEGTYSPSCVAFAGSNIVLTNGRFTWEKFTDAVVVDDEGNVVNQFPGYPMQGSYRIEGRTVHMKATSGEPLADMYLHEHNDRQFLLTEEQSKAWNDTGEIAQCALVLGGNDRN